MLDLVFKLSELGDNLLAFLLLRRIFASSHGAVGIVNCLGLELYHTS